MRESFREIRQQSRLREWERRQKADWRERIAGWRRELQVEAGQAAEVDMADEGFELQKALIQRDGWYPSAEEIAGLLRARVLRQKLIWEEWR